MQQRARWFKLTFGSSGAESFFDILDPNTTFLCALETGQSSCPNIGMGCTVAYHVGSVLVGARTLGFRYFRGIGEVAGTLTEQESEEVSDDP